MAANDGLLTHLAAQLRLQPEPLATEALAWVLREPAAARGLTAYLRRTDRELPRGLEFRHQVVAAGGSRPDLVGYDEQGLGRLVVEVKFDAPLMPSQPEGYLRQAQQARDAARAQDGRAAAAVLFVVPQQRADQ